MRQTQFFDQRNNTQASWLFFKDGLVGCVLCKAAGKKNIFGRCLAEPKLGNIIRHAEKTADHAAALQQWNDATQHVVPEAHAGGGAGSNRVELGLVFRPCVVSAHFGPSWRLLQRFPAVAPDCAPRHGRRLPLSDRGPGLQATHHRFCGQVIGGHQKLFEACSVAGVTADAREEVLGVCLRMVLWKWPRGVTQTLLPKGRGCNHVPHQF